MAEGVGFEPTELSLNGFQDRRLKPLGHSSVARYLLAYKNAAFVVTKIVEKSK